MNDCKWPQPKCFMECFDDGKGYCYWHRKVLKGLVDTNSLALYELEDLRHKEGYLNAH